MLTRWERKWLKDILPGFFGFADNCIREEQNETNSIQLAIGNL